MSLNPMFHQVPAGMRTRYAPLDSACILVELIRAALTCPEPKQ